MGASSSDQRIDTIWIMKMMQVEGNNANADDAIMLDKDGFVSETNATNIVSLF